MWFLGFVVLALWAWLKGDNSGMKVLGVVAIIFLFLILIGMIME